MREQVLGNASYFNELLNSFLLYFLYPEEGSIAKTSVKQFLTASKFSFFNLIYSINAAQGSLILSHILTATLIGFSASSDVCNENKLLDQRDITTKFSLYKHLSQLFHKSNRIHFL